MYKKHNEINYIGRVVGRLTLLSYIPKCKKSGRIYSRYVCNCSCGNTNYEARASDIYKAHSGSLNIGCGCLIREHASRLCKARTKHGRADTPEHLTWMAIRRRCYNINDQDYKFYGGRGIKVCDRWRESFANFYEDMGPKPTKKHSIDRIDVNGDYSPENCRWTTHHIQVNNRRSNRKDTAFGRTQSLSLWAIELDVNYMTLFSYITYKEGRTVEDFCKFRGIVPKTVESTPT